MNKQLQILIEQRDAAIKAVYDFKDGFIYGITFKYYGSSVTTYSYNNEYTAKEALSNEYVANEAHIDKIIIRTNNQAFDEDCIVSYIEEDNSKYAMQA